MLREIIRAILLPHQFLHDREHVDVAFVDEDFGVFHVRLHHLRVAIMHVVDAVAGSEVAADLDGIFAHFAGDAAVEGDAVSLAINDVDQVLPAASVAMICCEPRLSGKGGSLGCSARRTLAFSATGTTAFRK